ncbi:PX domain-containing protein 1 [Elsinoe australis]|uniref:Sorting nexin-4 n=1 Tax=Elsinoe australis TaxID=40998 RepID=A0A4U7B702_9PEZI|nr:PX domain-containing protein 1 [Elsinoe australis]
MAHIEQKKMLEKKEGAEVAETSGGLAVDLAGNDERQVAASQLATSDNNDEVSELNNSPSPSLAASYLYEATSALEELVVPPPALTSSISSSLIGVKSERGADTDDEDTWDQLQDQKLTGAGLSELDDPAELIEHEETSGATPTGNQLDWRLEKANRLRKVRAGKKRSNMEDEGGYHGDDWQQAGEDAAPQDVAGPGNHGRLECKVGKPQKENEGTQNQFISYLVTTDTDFKSFSQSHISVRRRFTDFVFLYKTLSREYPQCAVPPLPDKHKMEYVRGDRFGSDFTSRRSSSLERFLKRIAMHPVLRRAALFAIFLESNDWNATMKTRPSRAMSQTESQPSVLETWTDSFLNAFSKPHKTDRRFLEVRESCDKLDDDLSHVSKNVARVARRESDLETDFADLANQMRKLALLEPGVQNELHAFVAAADQQSHMWKGLRDHTDNEYLSSLKDMEAYCGSVKGLLKTREQKQLDFEGLTDYNAKAVAERDNLASNNSAIATHGITPSAATAFLRQKVEDVRGVNHEASRRDKVRKLDVQIRRLQDEVEGAKKLSELFDEEVVKEVQDFERIKADEFRDTLGGLADKHLEFFNGSVEVWEKFLKEMERSEAGRDGQ